MLTIMKIKNFILLSLLLTLSSGWSQRLQTVPGFEDKNSDGINDRFADADGDGINDVSGKAYAHAFKFQDKNRDGLNDLWVDADGDGVNDLMNRKDLNWVDMDGDGIRDEDGGRLQGKALRAHVLDMNKDGKNDITGEPITDESLGGYKYGQVDEEAGVRDRGFSDTDGDGKNDRSAGSVNDRGKGGMDEFIDQDGDGIQDERGMGRQAGRQKNKKQ